MLNYRALLKATSELIGWLPLAPFEPYTPASKAPA